MTHRPSLAFLVVAAVSALAGCPDSGPTAPPPAAKTKAKTKAKTGKRRAPRSGALAPPKAKVPPKAHGELLLVAGPPERVALLTPVLAKRAQADAPSWLLVHPGEWNDRLRAEVKRLAPSSVVRVGVPAAKELGGTQEQLDLPADAAAASLVLAQRFWGKSEVVVTALADDAGGIILGATLAAHLRAPLVLGARTGSLRAELAKLQPQTVLCLQPAAGKAWGQDLAAKVESLTHEAAERRIVARLRKAPVRCLAVGRAPQKSAGQASWLLPYYSWARQAGVVLLHEKAGPVEAQEAERRVRALIAAEQLKPRSVLLLASYHDVEMSAVRIPVEKEQEEYTLGVEPCSNPAEGKAASLGVGRVPFGLVPASRLLLRSIARKRFLAGEEPRALMIANPNPEHGALPLAEAVSRVTSRELKNRRVRVAEFYGLPSDHPQVRAATRTVHLILYTGHLGDQRILDKYGLPQDDEEFFLDAPAREAPPPAPEGAERERIGQPPPRPTPGQGGAPPLDRLLPGKPAAATGKLASWGWNGMPVLVLQSCYSLDEKVLARLHRLGGTGFVGSVTKIHSASGSTFLHAVVHGLLERGHTLGEALRDAKNYFLLLQDLKNLRGHKEQAKSLRVALSFRLWGDPELRVFPKRSQPKRPGVKLAWSKPDGLQLTFPKRRLVWFETDKFAVRVFPGSELAGMVKTQKKKKLRRILPVHFQRLRTPKGFTARSFKRLVLAGEKRPTSAFRVDEQGRALYVLHFPPKEKPATTVLLRFQDK